MSYYPSQSYGSYQTPYPAYPSQTSYSAQYPQAQPSQSSVPLYQSPVPKTSSSPPPELPAAPDLPAVTPQVASDSIRKLLSAELRHAGFDSAEPYAMHRLEMEVIAFVEKVFKFAHDYANHAGRTNAIATDAILACKRYGVDPHELHKEGINWKKRKREQDLEPPVLIPPPPRSPSPELLGSDDEETGPIVPNTLRSLPHYLPELPPKHTYLRTPASPPKKAALPSLEKKLKNASLVQDSLKNLLLATEDNTGQEDGELLGAIVNWETTTHPRKRWKLGA
ncbi:Transcription initiation factor TFIID subunit 8 [Abortiporus biennis]